MVLLCFFHEDDSLSNEMELGLSVQQLFLVAMRTETAVVILVAGLAQGQRASPGFEG